MKIDREAKVAIKEIVAQIGGRVQFRMVDGGFCHTTIDYRSRSKSFEFNRFAQGGNSVSKIVQKARAIIGDIESALGPRAMRIGTLGVALREAVDDAITPQDAPKKDASKDQPKDQPKEAPRYPAYPPRRIAPPGMTVGPAVAIDALKPPTRRCQRRTSDKKHYIGAAVTKTLQDDLYARAAELGVSASTLIVRMIGDGLYGRQSAVQSEDQQKEDALAKIADLSARLEVIEKALL